ncbi:MAG: hypothetical protein Q8O58_09455 [Gallionella sp.]|nr:hypothetical protein [Gallionella sp.]
MSNQPDERHRRSLRLKGYDYSQAGAYFVTICAHGKECLFGEIESGVMRLNEYGDIVASEWMKSAEVRSEIECGEFVLMPNHFHGIVHIVGAYGNTPIFRDEQKKAYSHTPLRRHRAMLGQWCVVLKVQQVGVSMQFVTHPVPRYGNVIFTNMSSVTMTITIE